MIKKIVRRTVGFAKNLKGDISPNKLRSAELADIFSGTAEIPVTLENYVFKYGDMPPHELISILQIFKYVRPKRVFEIGTFEGGTTLQFAANSEATIFTLDLPVGDPKSVWDADLDVYPSEPGARFKGTPFAGKITQLLGDSASFDFSPYNGSVDFIFLDGCHHYEFVVKDSENALKMLSPNGMIVWHDYASYAPGVVRALEELAEQVQLYNIKDTSLVVYADQRAESISRGASKFEHDIRHHPNI